MLADAHGGFAHTISRTPPAHRLLRLPGVSWNPYRLPLPIRYQQRIEEGCWRCYPVGLEIRPYRGWRGAICCSGACPGWALALRSMVKRGVGCRGAGKLRGLTLSGGCSGDGR